MPLPQQQCICYSQVQSMGTGTDDRQVELNASISTSSISSTPNAARVLKSTTITTTTTITTI